jgi:undecaprenyl-diphosphatase
MITKTLNTLLEMDQRVTLRLRIADKPGPLHYLLAVISHSGDSWYWALGLTAIVFFGTPDWRYRALVMLLSVVLVAPLVLLLKRFIHRPRPEGEWGNIYRKTDPHSFPSGHSVRAFMLAVLAAGLGPPWFSVTIFLWAPLVGISRIAMGVHYIADVVVGAVIGLLAGGIILLIVL